MAIGKCPFLLTTNQTTKDCLGKECRWYYIDANECAINILVLKSSDILKKIENSTKK